MSGQLALAVSEEEVGAPGAVWETLPVEVQRRVSVRMARLLGRWLGEVARGERRAEDHLLASTASRGRVRAAVDRVAGRGQRGIGRASTRCVNARSLSDGRLLGSRSSTRTPAGRALRLMGGWGFRSW